MKGTRPLTNAEIRAVRDVFTGTYQTRNAGLFMLGVSVGGRISELLALKVSDVWQNNKPVTDILFEKGIVKGKETARTVPVNADGQTAIQDVIDWHKGYYSRFRTDRVLFPSQKAKGVAKPLKRQAAHKILKQAFEAAGLNGKLATHSLRKTFAQRLYDTCQDIYVVMEMLGHKSVATTQAYLGVNYGTVREAVEAMALAAEDKQNDPLDAFDEKALIGKLTQLGYLVVKKNDAHNETTEQHGLPPLKDTA